MAKKTSTIHLRVEPGIKADVEKLLDRLGLTTTDAINIFLNQVVLTGGLPFQIRLPKPNPETIAAIEDVDKNRNMSRTFDSVDELMKDLNA